MFNSTSHPRSLLTVLAATVAVAAPGAAQASPLHDHHDTDERIGRVIPNAGAKPLSLRDARKAQLRAARTGRFPAAPRLASTKGLRRGALPEVATRRRPASKGAERVPLTTGKPSQDAPKLFGYQGTYATKKWILVNWVNYTYATVLGSSFRQPAVYEVPNGGTAPGGCGPTTNAIFCWGGMNTSAFSSTFSNSVFDAYGDAAFAAVMAHEFGHGAMSWLGLAGRGQFVHQIYREGFADCMAGAWLFWMHYHGYTDTIGRGDRQELYDVMDWLGSSNAQTTYTNHGDRGWRTSLSTYGWNSGFDGCIAWGRRLAVS